MPWEGTREGELMSGVVVVGAGLAAARRLVAGGHEVAVVEPRERGGGRTEGLVLDDGTALELGGQWLGEGHTRMYELVAELGLSTFPTWNEGQLLLDLLGRRSTMKPHKNAVPHMSLFALADLAQGLLRFGRLAARTSTERPWLTAGAEALDGQTWERAGTGATCAPRQDAPTSTSRARPCGSPRPATSRCSTRVRRIEHDGPGSADLDRHYPALGRDHQRARSVPGGGQHDAALAGPGFSTSPWPARYSTT